MKKLISLTLLIMFFITISCEKSNPDPLEEKPIEPDTEIIDDEDKPPAIYDSIVLNEIALEMDGYEWPIHEIDVTYQNSKLYFSVHTKNDFNATLHFILVNFAVDSFPFGMGSSNIVNFRYPVFNEYGALVDEWVTGFNGGLPGGYFVIDFIDSTELIVYGYFEFTNLENTINHYGKIEKSYFKVNYDLGTNSLINNSAEIKLNSKRLNVIDIQNKNIFSRINSKIVFDDNSAVQMALAYRELEMGINLVASPGFNAAWLNNVDFFLSYYNFPPSTYSQADSGYVNIKVLDIENQIVEGDLNLYFESDNITGSFEIHY